MPGTETLPDGKSNPPCRTTEVRARGGRRFSGARNRVLALAAALPALALATLGSGLAATPASAHSFSKASSSSLGISANGVLSSNDTTSCGAGFTDDPNDPTTSDDVCIPDTNLLDTLDDQIGLNEGTQITVAQAQAFADGGALTIAVPVANLTGLQVFSGLTGLTLNKVGNTFTDLTPISGLTTLNSLSLLNDSALTGADLAPLTSLTNLTTLSVSNDSHVSDVSSISSMTWLTSVTLNTDSISNLSGLPIMPTATTVSLVSNQIQDPSPLATELAGAGATLKTLNLRSNVITDASSLAPLGASGDLLGSSSGTLTLSSNRIKDFSAFSGWTHAPAATGQTVYVGPYKSGGVTAPLSTGTSTSPSVSAGTGTYNTSSGLLTVTASPVPATVAVSPDWTVSFSYPPGDPGGPTIVNGTSGTNFGQPISNPQVGQRLLASVTGSGSALAGCTNVSYEWLRDGAPIVGVPHADDDAGTGIVAGGDNAMGMSGTGALYNVSVTDLGHQISVRATCEDTTGSDVGVSVLSGMTDPIASGYAADQPLIQAMDGYSTIATDAVSGSPVVNPEVRSAVVGDPTLTTVPVYVAQLDENGNLVDPSQITLAVTSVGTAGGITGTPMTTSDVTIATDPDNPAERLISFDPQEVGNSAVTFTLTGTTGLTTSFNVGVDTSIATTPTSTVLENSSDDSSAIDVGDGYFLVADDEKNNIGLYNGAVSGREVAQFSPPKANDSENDLEASAQKGNQVYFFGSEGNNKSGESTSSDRNVVWSATLSGAGANATLTPGVEVRGFLDDLKTWDQAHGNWFGITAGDAEGKLPELLNGVDLEGAEFSPDGSEIYLGMRAPIAPTTPGTPQTPGGDAVIFTVTNFDSVMAAVAAGQAQPHWQFGDPILLNLDGQSIREIRKNADNQYLIISGQAGTEDTPANHSGPAGNMLWAWDGQPGDQPQLLSTSQGSVQPSTMLPGDFQTAFESGEEGGDWEGIADMPNPITPGSQIRLLMDQGFDELYADEADNKDESNFVSKGRTDVFTMSGPVGAVADLTGSGSFPDQAANTVGSPQKITVTNNGSQPLDIGRVNTDDTDGVSGSNFLISQDKCSDTTLPIGGTCTVQVRFAPSATGTTSTAQLVVNSNVAGGTTMMALTGTSTELPTGPKGDTGQTGSQGDTGQQGSSGPQGGTGAQGGTGPKGDTGGQGGAGPQGPKGDTGARGPAGVSVKGSAGGSQTIIVDAKGDLVVHVRNAGSRSQRIRVRALATVNGKQLTLATSTITLKGGYSKKVTLRVGKQARAKLGHSKHALTVTATPLGQSGNRKAGTFKAKVAVAVPHHRAAH